MEWIQPIIDFLLKICNRRAILHILSAVAAFALGYWFCAAKRERQEAELIKAQAIEIKAFCDTARAAELKIIQMETECRILMWSKDKSIDSLKSIIKHYEEGNQEQD